MKSIINKTLALLMLGLVGACVQAQDAWTPPATVKFVSSMPVGSGPDNALRKVAQDLSEKWKTSVIIDNRPGGNGIVSLVAFAKEPAEATIYFGTVDNLAVYPVVTNQLDLLKPIDPFMGFIKADMMLVTPPNIKNLDQFKTALQKNPAYGSWAIGSQAHVDGIVLSKAFDVAGVHVPYRDYGQWFTDLSNGLMTYSFTTVASTRQLLAAGKLNYIAVVSDHRDSRFPDVPTLSEFTGKKLTMLNPFMVFATSSNLPDNVKNQIQRDIVEVINTHKMDEALDPIGYLPWHTSIHEFKKFYKTYGENYITYLKTNNIELK